MKNYLGQSVSPGLLQILQESVMWPNRSITGLFLQPTLMHNSITTCMSDYYPRHVSGLDMPILRRNNCTNTASGILALISGCTLHRLRAECSPLSTGVVYIGWRNNPILWCTVKKTSRSITIQHTGGWITNETIICIWRGQKNTHKHTSTTCYKAQKVMWHIPSPVTLRNSAFCHTDYLCVA